MRSSRVLALVATGLCCATLAQAKFGISKTRVMLPRPLPAGQPLLAETVFLEVLADGRDTSQGQADSVRNELERALQASGLYQLNDSESEAGARVTLRLGDVSAELRDEIRTESKYVKIGEREEWDDKKKQYVKKDVYGNRDEPVTWVRADGIVDAELEVDPGDGHPSQRRVSADYRGEQKRDRSLPDEMRSERALRDWLIEAAAAKAVAEVVVHPEPVEALLAVNGELKDGNRLALEGRYRQALEAWSRRTFKGDTEAARLHNLGVAYEALAYGIPPWDTEHKDLLEKAKDHYARARALDPDEKYFTPPIERVAASLANADAAITQKVEIDRFRSQGSARRAVASGPTRVSRTPTPAAAEAEPGSSASATAPVASDSLLANGSFESGFDPWILSGKGALVTEPGRSKVGQLVADAADTGLAQRLSLELKEGASVPLRLDYRVTSGDARLSVRVVYLDGAGKQRTSTLEITAGEGPGAWYSWGSDLAALRPRPARLHELHIEALGGTVRLDHISLRMQ